MHEHGEHTSVKVTKRNVLESLLEVIHAYGRVRARVRARARARARARVGMRVGMRL